jgi:hypothetical protein
MGTAPLRVPLAVLADQDTETYASLAVTAITQLMEADHLSLPSRLCSNNRA